MIKTINISYIKSWKIEDDMLLPVKGNTQVAANFTKFYHGALYRLAGLRPAARNLIEFLVQRMDDKNYVFHNKQLRESFISIIDKATDGEVVYSDVTVKSAFKQLVDKGLLLNVEVGNVAVRGVYLVNPEFFFQDNDMERIESIRILLNGKAMEEKRTIENQFKNITNTTENDKD